MIGAVVSDARLDRMYNRPIQPCSWCQNPDAIPCWDQAAWSCPAFSSSRSRRPASAFQRILGWPTVTALKFRINSDKCSGSRPLAVRADGEVVTRGDSGCGGGSSSIQKRLRNVLQIQAMVIKIMVETALKSKISSRMCSRYRLQGQHLLRS